MSETVIVAMIGAGRFGRLSTEIARIKDHIGLKS
jgi:hypothetical protein